MAAHYKLKMPIAFLSYGSDHHGLVIHFKDKERPNTDTEAGNQGYPKLALPLGYDGWLAIKDLTGEAREQTIIEHIRKADKLGDYCVLATDIKK